MGFKGSFIKRFLIMCEGEVNAVDPTMTVLLRGFK